MRKITLGILIIALPAFLLSCSNEKSSQNWLEESFDEIEKAASETEVTFFMWGGDAKINAWIDGFVSEQMMQKYDIRLKRVPMDASEFVSKLLNEKQADKKIGSIDLVWINGENFKRAKNNGLLFGPYTELLPSYSYVDVNEVSVDFDFPVDGYEAPYGKAQFVFEYDQQLLPEPPKSFKELLVWVKEHPGQFTYPQPPDFTGSAFIRQAFYAVSGGHEQFMGNFNEQLYTEKAELLWEYLNQLKSFLWQEGKNYPKDKSLLDTLFEKGEVKLNMSYHQALAQSRIDESRYPESIKTFVMEEGSIANIHFTAIAFNAPNKPGALVLSNFLFSPEAQLSKNDPANWGDFTVLDLTKLSEDYRKAFLSLELGEATLPLNKLAEAAVPEVNPDYVERLEKDWETYVLNQE